MQTDYEAWRKIGGIRDKDSFKERIAKLCPAMTVIEELTNGTKHFRQHDRLERTQASKQNA
jgi:hypothetical protein